MKLRTVSLLQDCLDEEFAWRLKEIASLKLWLKSASAVTSGTAIRATLPLVYAHWEGFVRASSIAYVNHVSCQRLTYNELQGGFVALGMRRHIYSLLGTRKSRLRIEVVEHLRTGGTQRAQLGSRTAVDTRSNLSSEVFEDILLSLGIDPGPYRPRYKLIDESLLRRRNSIAHGEFLELDGDDCRLLSDEMLKILRMYKSDLENAAVTRCYRR